MALVTDGEEAGLMGAAGLVTDREVMNRLRAYLNIESIGSSGTAVLFETGQQRLAGGAVGPLRAAPARRIVRHRSVPPGSPTTPTSPSSRPATSRD
jgi:hypothetical protein